MAQLFHESGLDVVFVDVAEDVVSAINSRGSYFINIVGEGASRVPIDHIRGVDARDIDVVAREVAAAEIVCTAVGASALPGTAPAIAAGLEKRCRLDASPLNILLCENLHNASDLLRTETEKLLPETVREPILARTGFVQAVVSRMVPLQTDSDRANDPLGVRVEAYKQLPVDADAWVGETAASAYVGFQAVAPFEAYVERKLFTHNCAHAVLGYLGYAAGHQFGYEALHDVRIDALLRAVLNETGLALINKHGFDAVSHSAHVADLLRRFDNRELGDTCLRLARDPLRKLAPGDRITGAARCCEAQNVTPAALSWAIAAALKYDDPADPSAVKMQSMLIELGRETALKRICGILPYEPLAQLVDEAMDTTLTGAA